MRARHRSSPAVALLLGVLASVATLPAVAADPPRQIHGSADAFAASGIALAWGVLRAPKEDDTAVVIRIEPDASVYAWVEVVGNDPFTQREETVLRATEVGGPFDLKVPRARFAEFPRTEIRLWRSGSAPGAAPPALTVYYVGVPDTTPEVLRAVELDRSLAARIARARAASPGGTP